MRARPSVLCTLGERVSLYQTGICVAGYQRNGKSDLICRLPVLFVRYLHLCDRMRCGAQISDHEAFFRMAYIPPRPPADNRTVRVFLYRSCLRHRRQELDHQCFTGIRGDHRFTFYAEIRENDMEENHRMHSGPCRSRDCQSLPRRMGKWFLNEGRRDDPHMHDRIRDQYGIAPTKKVL